MSLAPTMTTGGSFGSWDVVESVTSAPLMDRG
jgi:hypothetical protein